MSVVSLLDNIARVYRRYPRGLGNHVEPRRGRNVSSLSAWTYFRGLRLCSAASAIGSARTRARVPELRAHRCGMQPHRSFSPSLSLSLSSSTWRVQLHGLRSLRIRYKSIASRVVPFLASGRVRITHDSASL